VNLQTGHRRSRTEIRKWRIDPNYISVVSVPLGFERLGGDGRALLLGPEIEVTNKEITGGMGVPIEFVFGGLSWSGSSVSLRTLENHFLLYRRLLLRFVNWVKNRVRIYLNLADVDIGFTEFKMADDIQRKQIVIQLNAANKISDHTMLTELGFDYDEEQKKIEKEAEDRNKIQAMMMKAQTEAQGEARSSRPSTRPASTRPCRRQAAWPSRVKLIRTHRTQASRAVPQAPLGHLVARQIQTTWPWTSSSPSRLPCSRRHSSRPAWPDRPVRKQAGR
jgi:hypothetical protein